MPHHWLRIDGIPFSISSTIPRFQLNKPKCTNETWFLAISIWSLNSHYFHRIGDFHSSTQFRRGLYIHDSQDSVIFQVGWVEPSPTAGEFFSTMKHICCCWMAAFHLRCVCSRALTPRFRRWMGGFFEKSGCQVQALWVSSLDVW